MLISCTFCATTAFWTSLVSGALDCLLDSTALERVALHGISLPQWKHDFIVPCLMSLAWTSYPSIRDLLGDPEKEMPVGRCLPKSLVNF